MLHMLGCIFFKEIIFSSIFFPFGPHFPAPCFLRKTRKHFPPFPVRKHDSDLNNFEQFWIICFEKVCQHCWSNSKVISKLWTFFCCLDSMRSPDLARLWCPSARRFANQASWHPCWTDISPGWSGYPTALFLFLFLLLAAGMWTCKQDFWMVWCWKETSTNVVSQCQKSKV